MLKAHHCRHSLCCQTPATTPRGCTDEGVVLLQQERAENVSKFETAEGQRATGDLNIRVFLN